MKELENKLKRLRKLIKEENLDILLITDLHNLRWFHGQNEEFGTLIVSHTKASLFISPLSIDNFDKEAFSKEGVEIISLDKDFEEKLNSLIQGVNPNVIGFEETLKYRVFSKFQKMFKDIE